MLEYILAIANEDEFSITVRRITFVNLLSKVTFRNLFQNS